MNEQSLNSFQQIIGETIIELELEFKTIWERDRIAGAMVPGAIPYLETNVQRATVKSQLGILKYILEVHQKRNGGRNDNGNKI